MLADLADGYAKVAGVLENLSRIRRSSRTNTAVEVNDNHVSRRQQAGAVFHGARHG